jgi:hypothetical protein
MPFSVSGKDNQMIKTTSTKSKQSVSRFEKVSIEGLLPLLSSKDKQGLMLHTMFQGKKSVELTNHIIMLFEDILGFKLRIKHYPILQSAFSVYGVSFIFPERIKRQSLNGKVYHIPC